MNRFILVILAGFILQNNTLRAQVYDFTAVNGEIDFSRIIMPWDGFGFNYVEFAQSLDPAKDVQDLGGFTLLSDKQKQEIIELVFGENGLKISVVKMFLDPWHQKEASGPFDHKSTTANMLYFVREGLKKTKAGGRNLSIITTLYGPPPFIRKQKHIRGRDLDTTQKANLIKYMIDWVRYLKKEEGLPVKYLSIHNEGEESVRWHVDGVTPEEQNHDYNLFWPHQQVNEFLILMPPALAKAGLGDVGITPGEASNWERFYRWGYADKIADNPKALKSMSLITSHGFFGLGYTRWHSMHVSAGNDVIRIKRPELHSWVTSTSWANMDAIFVRQLFSNIYFSKSNSIIPWAGIQRLSMWKGGNPNRGSAILVKEDSTYELRKGYYYYKQATQAGQAGMGVCRNWIMDSELAIMAFARQKTKHPDAFVIINNGPKEKPVSIQLKGTAYKTFEAFRTNDKDGDGAERYLGIGIFTLKNGLLTYTVPPGSATTFFGK